MSGLLPVQRDLARLLFSLPEAAGYALAGGAALVVQQIVDRDTRDLDAFIAATPGPASGQQGSGLRCRSTTLVATPLPRFSGNER